MINAKKLFGLINKAKYDIIKKTIEGKEKWINGKGKKLINSFKYAIQGLGAAIKTEQNMKIHIVAMILVVVVGIILKISKLDWIICIILFGLVISAELTNTAIETVVDIASPEINPKAKLAKDIAASSVLVLAIVAVIVGLIIFIPKIIEYIGI